VTWLAEGTPRASAKREVSPVRVLVVWVGLTAVGLVIGAACALTLLASLFAVIPKLGEPLPVFKARFDAERQALAVMTYEFIAKVFDVGSTDTGRP
jgi:eukaryotic-like serine/threonine-protein kinase